MKRTILGAFVIMAVFSSCGIFGPIDWPEFVSPVEAWYWIYENIEYKNDFSVHGVLEEWQTPEETMTIRSGDCDDKAILMAEFCHRMNIRCDVAIVWLPDLDVLWPAHMTPMIDGEFVEDWVAESRKTIIKVYSYEEIQEILHPQRAPGGKR